MKKIGFIIFLFGLAFNVQAADISITHGIWNNYTQSMAACTADWNAARAENPVGATASSCNIGQATGNNAAWCVGGNYNCQHWYSSNKTPSTYNNYCACTTGTLDCSGSVALPYTSLDGTKCLAEPEAPYVPTVEPGTPSVKLEFTGEPPAAICHNGTWHARATDDVVVSDGAGNNLAQYTDSGETCTPDDTGITENTGGCITGMNGATLCLDQQTTNCGYYNDVYGCAEDIPATGTCSLLGGGGYICTDAAVPPVATGAPPETPLGEITNSTDEKGTVFTQGAVGGGSPPFSWSGPAFSDSPFADLQTELDAAKLAFSDAFGSIGTELETAFSANLSTGATYTCDGGITVHGWHIEICILPYLGALSILGLAIIFMATWTAITIVMET